ncbi:SH3 domain-containing protein [Sphingopyxis sp. YR583]|uniref:TIR domain-containing protein n=1 Tax=Sphingopyxis sp. YR583 TaxID=1881047 RepID=UPI0008A72C04|nr:YARHG domain-containing protein [Sphingopyxis sp. YR583]SEH18567.1 SH3 domain-containing protein [Sphingopyxis sp. YR583]
MVDVFISYSRDNKARVADIASAVTAAGYDVWWDAELPPHRSYGDVITEKIGSAKAAIVVWSHTSAASEWVRAEADVARNQKKLVQTAIDDVMPPLPFNQIQFADLSDWNGDPSHGGWRKVLMSLEELCGREAVAAAPTTPAPVSRIAPPPAASDWQAAPPSQKSSFLPWALLGLAIVAVALLAWKLLQPAPTAPGATSVADAPAQPAANSAVAPDDAAPSVDAGPAEAFTLAAVINDPEGFTNIRAERSAQSEILGKVLDGEKFLTYKQSGAWWRVRKADGTTGFMFRKYIRLVEGPAPTIPAGAAPTGVGGSGVVIPDSSDRLLSADELGNYSALELRVARNEIFARNGFRFSDPSLRAHFSQFDWYRPTSDTVALSATEKANVALLKSAEAAAR